MAAVDIRSIWQPVATGAGAIPARPRTPDPFHGGMRGKEMETSDHMQLLPPPGLSWPGWSQRDR